MPPAAMLPGSVNRRRGRCGRGICNACEHAELIATTATCVSGRRCTGGRRRRDSLSVSADLYRSAPRATSWRTGSTNRCSCDPYTQIVIPNHFSAAGRESRTVSYRSADAAVSSPSLMLRGRDRQLNGSGTAPHRASGFSAMGSLPAGHRSVFRQSVTRYGESGLPLFTVGRPSQIVRHHG